MNIFRMDLGRSVRPPPILAGFMVAKICILGRSSSEGSVRSD